MDKVKVAMIGCGGFQRYRLNNLLKIAEAEVVALVDTSEKQIALTHEAHPSTQSAQVFEDHRAMLEKVKPDAVMIATPHTQHVGQIMDSFEAGANVLCEKPLVTSTADAYKIIAKRDEVKKVGMVSYQRHYQAEFRTIRERIQSGEAGPLQYVQVLQGQNWLRLCRGSWRQELALSGGGQLNDSGSHVIDVVLWVTGASVDHVTALIENFDCEVDINSTVSIRFKNGALGSIAIVGNGFAWHEDVTFFCEEQVFYVRDGKLTIVNRKDDRFLAEHLGGGSTPDRNFIDAILGKAECESPFECGLEVIRLTEAAWESAAKGGQPVKAN